jgi:hypothetical protein
MRRTYFAATYAHAVSADHDDDEQQVEDALEANCLVADDGERQCLGDNS